MVKISCGRVSGTLLSVLAWARRCGVWTSNVLVNISFPASRLDARLLSFGHCTQSMWRAYHEWRGKIIANRDKRWRGKSWKQRTLGDVSIKRIHDNGNARRRHGASRFLRNPGCQVGNLDSKNEVTEENKPGGAFNPDQSGWPGQWRTKRKSVIGAPACLWKVDGRIERYSTPIHRVVLGISQDT